MIKYRNAALGDESKITSLMNKYVDAPWNENQVKDEISSGALFFVAVNKPESNDNGDINNCAESGEVVGFLSGVVGGDECELSDIAVDERYRKIGIATRLFELLFNELKNKKVNKVFLLVRFNNDPAVSLYNKLGFNCVGKRKGYYGGADALIMKKDL